MSIRLGRVPPPDDGHIRSYPLTLELAEELPPSPVVLGISWLRSFSSPQEDSRGACWVGRGDPATWGPEDGGHAICLEPGNKRNNDSFAWWPFYNQIGPSCVGYSTARAMSLSNRKRYDGRWTYDRCKERDGYAGDGTYVRTGFEVLMELGPMLVRGSRRAGPLQSHGISEFRWARSVEEIFAALSVDINRGYVTLLNSWGRDGYPHRVRMPAEALDRMVFQMDGEAGVVTDRP